MPLSNFPPGATVNLMDLASLLFQSSLNSYSPGFAASVNLLADLLTLIKQVWIESHCIAAHPKRDVKRRHLPAVDVIGSEIDVADRQVPIVIDKIDPLVRGLWSNFIGVRL